LLCRRARVRRKGSRSGARIGGARSQRRPPRYRRRVRRARYIAAAPDLFWRTIPGPLARDDGRTKQRSQPRLEKIRTGEGDLVDALAEVRKLPQSNGRAAVMGFCYGGPYAILGSKRLGYDAGISCHGSQMLDYIASSRPDEAGMHHLGRPGPPGAGRGAGGVSRRGCAHEESRPAHLPGVQHGYMMPESKAFDQKTRDFSMERALAILNGLRAGETRRKAG